MTYHEPTVLIKLREPGSCYVPSIGLWSLKANWHHADVTIFDDHLHWPLRPRWDEIDGHTVGLSAQFSCQHDEMLAWAKELKTNYRNVKVIAGGAHAATLDCIPYVDQVFKGFSEGLAFDQIELPVVPRYALERYWHSNRPHNLKSKTKRWVPIETSRGCDGHCTYCGMPRFAGRWKGFSLDKLKTQLQAYKDLGVKEVFIEDDNVSYYKDRFLDLIRLLKDLRLHWSCPNGIAVQTFFHSGIVRALDHSTCWRVSLPFETGSLHTAQLMRIGPKFVEWTYADSLVKTLRKIKIKTAGFFLIGYPGETEEDVLMTLRYANALDLDDTYIYIATPYPGSALYTECVNKGYIETPVDYAALTYTQCIVNTPWLSAKRVVELRDQDRKENRK